MEEGSAPEPRDRPAQEGGGCRASWGLPLRRPLCGFTFAQRNCQLRGTACKGPVLFAVSLARGSKPADAHHRPPHAWCSPGCLLCTFSPTLGCLLRRQISLLGEMLFPEPRREPYKLGTVVGWRPWNWDSGMPCSDLFFTCLLQVLGVGDWGEATS